VPLVKISLSLLTLTLTMSSLPLAATAQPPLQSAVVTKQQLPREYRLDGMVEAVNRTTVSAQTGGEVEEILFDVDDFVEQGSVILRLKDIEQRAQLSQAEADLKEASARYLEAQEVHERTRNVFAKKLVAQAEMDAATAALKAAEARRDAAAAQLQRSKEQFAYTQVRAPYSGIVTERFVELGEIARVGQKLVSGISLDQLRVIVDVPQSLIPAIRTYKTARVQQPGNGYITATKITIFPYAHHGSNTFKVRLDLPEGTTNMFPGMFVKTAFTLGQHEELVIPEESVVYRSEVTGAYVIGADGRISLRHIRLGRASEDGMVTILSGLEEGERVALDPIEAGTRLKQQASQQHE
jgi:RND family efflux transporter MFP subunit